MDKRNKKKRVISSSAAIISIVVHVLLIVFAGGLVALKFYKKKDASFQVENQQKKLERRKLKIPVKTDPFITQMSKPEHASSDRITANSPQMVNIPKENQFVKQVPMPSFKNSYTNFVKMDRSLEFNSKYRNDSFGESKVNFFGTKETAEKVVIVIDTSKSMLFDATGGAKSFKMVKNNLRRMIMGMRSATLFNVVLFDNTKVATFTPELTAATPQSRQQAIKWVSSINTNLSLVGLSDEMVNYQSKIAYDTPMAATEISGWLKGFQAAIELQPEAIFVLAAEWGNTTTAKDGISYFLKKDMYDAYQQSRLALIDSDEDLAEELVEYNEDIYKMRDVALKMLELENQAREEMEMQPKVVRDWDDILRENGKNVGALSIPDKLMEEIDVSPVATRYTHEEVLETLFVIAMDNYREKGFPALNFVMLNEGSKNQNSESSTSLMTSTAKFESLAKMVSGKLRYLKGIRPIDNELKQRYNEVLELIEEPEESDESEES